MSDEAQPYTFDRVVRLVLAAVAVVAGFALLRYLADVLLPFVAAVILAYLLNPIVGWIERRTKRRWLAVTATLAGLGVGLLLLLFLLVPIMLSQVHRFERATAELRGDLVASWTAAAAAPHVDARLGELSAPVRARPGEPPSSTGARHGEPPAPVVVQPNEPLGPAPGRRDDAAASSSPGSPPLAADAQTTDAASSTATAATPTGRSDLGLRELLDGWTDYRRTAGEAPRPERLRRLRDRVQGTYVGTLVQHAADFVQTQAFRELLLDAVQRLAVGGAAVINFAVDLVLAATVLIVVLIYLVFLLLDFKQYAATWRAMLPPKYGASLLAFLSEFEVAMRRYFRGQFLVACCVGVLCSIGFTLIGLPMGILLGLFVGLLNMVPYLQLVALVPAGVLALLRALESNGSVMGSFAWVLVVMGVVQVLQDAVIVPRIMGRTTGLRPVSILLGVFIWGKLLGFIGLLLAIPLTCLGIACYRRHVLDAEKAPCAQPPSG